MPRPPEAAPSLIFKDGDQLIFNGKPWQSPSFSNLEGSPDDNKELGQTLQSLTSKPDKSDRPHYVHKAVKEILRMLSEASDPKTIAKEIAANAAFDPFRK